MKYLLIFLASYVVTFYTVGAIIGARLQGLSEDLRQYPYAPIQAQYLEDVRLHARHSRIEYCAILGTLLAMLASLLVWALS
ncbi:hypothetical protein [Pseudomonas sp. UM16]|uniref:hypothetical protein n=1 Tax=Pseudomonas sp. UM16 TaxID=3158962 RepID=UPI0039900A7E